MDITKATKPIHIRCPNCKKDIPYNVTSIKSRKEGMISRLEAIDRKLPACTDKQQRKDLLKKKKETLFRLKLLSEDLSMLSQMAETETLKIFKRKVGKILPNDTFIRLMEESEAEYLEENTFNYYDAAIQKYNTFESRHV